MNWIVAFFIPIPALFVGPTYLLLSRKQPSIAKNVRVTLLVTPLLQLIISFPILLRLPSLLHTSVGLFDDAMYMIYGFAVLSLVASVICILLDRALSILWIRIQKRNLKTN